MKKSSSIVIIGNDDDAHIPYVSRYFTQAPVIIGPKLLIERKEISIYPLSGELIIDGKSIGNPSSFWYRKPWSMMKQLPIPSEYKEYASGSIRRHIGVVSVFYPDAFWISKHTAMARAEYKPLQLKEAKALGFLIPKTLFTSDELTARQFINSQTSTIIKSTSSSSPQQKHRANGSGTVMWARKVSPDIDVDFSGLHLAPAIFQQAVESNVDIRVTVVGNKVFAARISTTQVNEKYASMRDWRVGVISGNMTIEECTIPADIANKCRALVRKLDLAFGAIDLVMDDKGKYWFLEINPNGQWAFVEDETGQPIGKAIADLLMSWK